ncbi:LCP family protein [Saccharopolyspora phatthalungensis]|uniref:LCP family protein required for cell wall assembly n=1 Tax=Saccharopolyspora phatthalungensis TaxID=664693 RepID=A0A840QGY0_9PSEU|nr:LCP family protein [Saccharopolyspora phatthalungensis]MBB5159756.1 LCP family protein required for cell wall assembly [Saccharopolyspora phatthalungensis]
MPPHRNSIGADRRPAPPRRRRSADNARLGARVVAMMLSALILVVTGYGWSNYRHLLGGLATSDVTDGAGADGATDILLVGMDSRTDAHGNPLPANVLRDLHAGDNEASLTDTIILLHIPTDGSSAVGFSFPRDAYVQIPGYGRHKINSAYGRGKEAAIAAQTKRGVTDPAELARLGGDAGRKLLVRTIEQLTGVSIDHYAEVNLLGFARITQAVGGVPVCLLASARDAYSGANFPAGPQTISGANALAFVRQRHGLPRGDLDRVVRQQAFLAGLTQSVVSGGVLANPARMRDLIGSVQESVVLDRDWDVLAFADRLRGLAGGAVRFTTIPIENASYDTPDDGEAILVDPRKVKDAISHTIEPPATGSSETSEIPDSAAAQPDAAQSDAVATVDVLNATRAAGLAQRVRTELANRGLPVGRVGNAPARSESVVRHGADSAAAANRVAALLGDLPTETDESIPDGRIQVIIGSDYRGPTAPRFAPPGGIRLDDPNRQATGNSPEAITANGIPCVN